MRVRAVGRAPRARAGAQQPRARPRAGRSTVPLAPALDARHPAFVFAIAIAAACIVIDVSFRLYDTDMWQHFAVGRAIWQLHQVPTRQLWTWPTYDAPDVNASWGFRALIWPIWHTFGVSGLFAWRWLSALAVFGLAWLAARRMGARGLSPLVVMALCALTYRQRSHIRPETLVSVLLAAQIWIHETWRARERTMAEGAEVAGPARATVGVAGTRATALPPDLRPWLVLIAWCWANAHISYWMGLAVQTIYLTGDWPRRATPVAPLLERIGLRGWRAPVAIFGASGAASFVNPWGWRALWQPFEYFLYWRHEPIFRTIAELAPIDWQFNQRNLLVPLLIGAALLLLWRARTRALDVVGVLIFGLFASLAIMTERFVGFLAVAIAPFVARDLDAWVRSRGAAAGGPATSSGARTAPDAAMRWTHALCAALLCVAVSVPEWTRISMPLGVAIDWRSAPVRACDFIADHDIRGRGFNQFAAGGYMVDRFWPDRTRLPFMDIHQAGTREDRYLYAWAQQDSAAWRMLDSKYRFDYVLLFTHQAANDSLIDRLGADNARWALVFSDDAGALFLRRDGPFATLAESLRYPLLPAGQSALNPSLARAATDTTYRRRLEAEFMHAARGSEWNSRAKTSLAVLADEEGREYDALQLLNEVIRDNALAPYAHEYRAEIELAMGKGPEALADLAHERRLRTENAELDLKLANVYRQQGRREDARHWYQRTLKLEPANQTARDSLARLEGAAPR